MSEAKWKAYIKGKKYGPVDAEAVVEWIGEGRVTEKTQLWCPGMPKWAKAAEVDDFAQYFGAPAEEPPEEEPAVEEPTAAEAVAEESPVAEAPAEEAPAEEEIAVEETPAEETPAEETPAEEAPVEEAPVEEAPAEEAMDDLFADDEAPTVIAESPFAEINEAIEANAPRRSGGAHRGDPGARASHAAEDGDAQDRQGAAAAAALLVLHSRRTDGRASCLSSLGGMFQQPPAGSSDGQSIEDLEAEVANIDLDDDDDDAPLKKTADVKLVPTMAYWYAIGAGVGLLLLIVLPLFFNKVGLVGGILGALVALGGWIGAVIVSKEPGHSIVVQLQKLYIAPFEHLGKVDAVVQGSLHWLLVLIPLFALAYYAFTGKYRARIS